MEKSIGLKLFRLSLEKLKELESLPREVLRVVSLEPVVDVGEMMKGPPVGREVKAETAAWRCC